MSVADATREGRRFMLLGAMGLTTYWACLWSSREAFGYSMAIVTPLFAGSVIVHLLLSVTASGWYQWRAFAAAYGVLLEMFLTVVLYLLGGLRAGFFFFVHLFPILLASIIGSEAAAFATAGVGALCVGALALGEVSGVVTPPPSFGAVVAPDQALGYVVTGSAGLAFFALYAAGYGHVLRNFAGQLQRQVAERTEALTEANAELAAKAKALEDKQEEVRTFVYTVTHDLKSPMNSILLTADDALEREGDRLSPAMRTDVESILRLAGGTEDMIRDLLGLFRVTSEPESAEWVSLRPVVEQAIETLKPKITQKRVRLQVHELPRVWGQPRKLGHVVTNLLSNAVKYVPDAHGVVDVSGRYEADWVVFEVADNGIGIPQSHLEHIFRLFGRVPAEVQGLASPVEGTGVGLAMVRRIVLTHGGTVTVTSRMGEGSTFTVRLPRRKES